MKQESSHPTDGSEVVAVDASTLVELLRQRALSEGDKRAFVFLQDGESESGHLTYAALDLKARSIAAWLQAEGLAGARIPLLFPSGLDFICAFFGCLYAGVVAVPAYPPGLNRNALRLKGLVIDSGAEIALTTSRIQGRIQPLLVPSEISSLRLMSVDTLPDKLSEHWQIPVVDGNTLALMQYTSGSTSLPKGVMLSHANLLENHRMMKHALRQTRADRIVTWLPMFHDLGLIGNVLQALYIGIECILMPPEAFLMKPMRWLAAISRYRATISCTPNFALDLCVKKISHEQSCALDLSCWDLALVAAEPVRHATLERFAKAFSHCGFHQSAIYPAYGLAEASVFVSGPRRGTGARRTTFIVSELGKHGVAIEAKEGSADTTRTLVSCGQTWLNQQLAIVDPEIGEPCPHGRVGEIWIAGPHLSRGYWGRPQATEETFGGTLRGEDGVRFLRTGDLGFLHEGELYISGRLKDLIIISGRNHDPSDVESTVYGCHEVVRPGGCAAFQVEMEDDSRLVIALELERTSGVVLTSSDDQTRLTTRFIIQIIRQAVAEHHGLTIFEVVLLKPGAMPKTSSGKVQRSEARKAWLNQTLKRWDPRN